MPELPEVETVRMGLLPVLEGHNFVRVETRRAGLRVPFPKDFAKRLTGRHVKRLWRRAKYLLAELDQGETLVIHLGMSGRMSVTAAGTERKLGQYVYDVALPEPGKHDHVVLETDTPARIVFTDHRRFGLMTLIDTATIEDDKLFKGLGVEPLSDAFDAAYLAEGLEGKEDADQICLARSAGDRRHRQYLCLRGVVPRRDFSQTARRENVKGVARRLLLAAIKAVLKEAIKAGGSTLRDHKKTNGELGYFQHHFAVYDRTGEPCSKKGCGGKVKRIVQAGRSTFCCPTCQKWQAAPFRTRPAQINAILTNKKWEFDRDDSTELSTEYKST